MAYLDHYCERAAAGLLGEPLNTLTNLAFIAGAIYVWRCWSRSGLTARQASDILLLIVLMAAIGFGSAAWHATAWPWAIWLDVVPILLFINVALLALLRRGLGWTWPAVVGGWLGYQALNQWVAQTVPAHVLNGSVFYLPTWATLGLLALATRRRFGTTLSVAWAWFSVSLLARTGDAMACVVLPTGTHFLWHLLNAAVLVLIALGLLRAAQVHGAPV
ncbi:ceramidase domain-containing protein [Chitinolyticbacter meiyuanensis]|uniref:ceramidase domain-containing protein n=1 Tax=Chitinolyticbacter meiyuanensis TaxID=682798 RepID=UPI0011E5B207|nr:ceramidase domain-containing protein [Chitinolyticbacter meiyuanensis]